MKSENRERTYTDKGDIGMNNFEKIKAMNIDYMFGLVVGAILGWMWHGIIIRR